MTKSATSIIFFSIVFALGAVSLATSVEAYEKELAALPALTLIHPGESRSAQERHQPGLPDPGTLRVYWFWSSVSPCSRRTEDLVAEFAHAHPDVELFVIHANANKSADQARQVAARRDFKAPIYRDEGAKLAVALDARITPEAIIFDSEGMVYKGRTDQSRRGKTVNHVADAVASWKAGEGVEPASRPPTGCPIQRP